MGGTFEKNSFILGMKYSFLEDTCSSLQPTCSDLHTEEPSSQDKLSLDKQFRFGSDSRKAVNRCVLDISAYCSIFNSTACSSLGSFFIVPENKHLYFHSTHSVELFTLHCFKCLSGADFINFYSDIRGICEAKFCRGTSFIFFTVICLMQDRRMKRFRR